MISSCDEVENPEGRVTGQQIVSSQSCVYIPMWKKEGGGGGGGGGSGKSLHVNIIIHDVVDRRGGGTGLRMRLCL